MWDNEEWLYVIDLHGEERRQKIPMHLIYHGRGKPVMLIGPATEITSCVAVWCSDDRTFPSLEVKMQRGCM